MALHIRDDTAWQRNLLSYINKSIVVLNGRMVGRWQEYSRADRIDQKIARIPPPPWRSTPPWQGESQTIQNSLFILHCTDSVHNFAAHASSQLPSCQGGVAQRAGVVCPVLNIKSCIQRTSLQSRTSKLEYKNTKAPGHSNQGLSCFLRR